MSNIDTNGIDVNYPVPGVNNSTQGFRSNFTAIKTNLDTAGNEITNLQQNVVLKAALANSTLNNDMANTLIANASTLGFRSTTYNLGNALTGTVLINASIADVHYGQIANNITLNTGSWSPVNTQQSIEIQLSTNDAEANYTISFPANVIATSNNYGTTMLENFANVSNVAQITFPYGVTQLNFRITTLDCGNSIYIEPINRNYQTTQLVKRTPPSTGQQGDKVGAVCVDPGMTQLVVTGANTDPYFTTSNTANLYTGLPVTFTGTSLEANIVVGNTYYIRNVVNSTRFTVSSSIGGANIAVAANATGTTMLLNPVQYMYVAVANYSANSYSIGIGYTDATTYSINVTGANTSFLDVNQPIIFPGYNGTGNIGTTGPDKVYYIKSYTAGNITISETRYNGVAGPVFTGIQTVASTAAAATDITFYDGADIWRRMPFSPF
jgi:hypothetical protein